MRRATWLLGALLLAGIGCTAPPFMAEERMFLGEAPDSISARRIRQWKAVRAREEAAAIPWAATMRFPSREEWSRISSRRPAGLPAEEKKP